jgi:hypothetical protein
MVKTLSIAILAVLLASNGWSRTYTTTFPATQNPICEGSPCDWAGGQSAGGNLWGNVQTETGFAYGVTQPTEFGDPTAIVTGTWGATQTVTATVKVNTPEVGCCQEVELRLRNKISTNSITGYEVYCSVASSGADYCRIARWGGPAGRYCNIEISAPAFHAITGDVFTATVSGTNPVVITGKVYRSGNLVATVTASDTGNEGGSGTDCGAGHAVYTSGNPGIGFYAYGGAGSTYFHHYGFTSFTATDGAVNAPTGLTATVH